MAEPFADTVIREQINLLRRLAEVCANFVASPRTNPKDWLDSLFAVQHELREWTLSVVGSELPGLPVGDAPAPLAAMRPAPPLHPVYDEDHPAVPEPWLGDTGVSFAPEPLWASDARAEDAGYDRDEDEERR